MTDDDPFDIADFDASGIEQVEFLTEGTMVVRGRLPWSSNATFLVEITHDDRTYPAVYKPGQGERPLWDFPGGLYRREAAAWELSQVLGWSCVPTTIVRDGPMGEGSVQWFVDADFSQHYFTMMEQGSEHHDAFMTLCAFDLVANNTDRKSGHCLLGRDANIWGIDHGLCFHEEFKIRTVIWEFAGEPVPDRLVAGLSRLALRGVPDRLGRWLTDDEADAVEVRAARLVDAGVFPHDPTGRRYPWPLV